MSTHSIGLSAGAPSKSRAALASVAVNVALTLIKASVALATGSIGLLAEAAHSMLDLTASILAYAGIKMASRPADEEHAFGHEKFENISSLAQMLLLIVTCSWILYEAVNRIIFGSEIVVSWYAFAIMGLAIIIDLSTSNYLTRTAQETGGSPALEADSLHFLSDMWGAVSVLLGLGAVAAFGLQVADPIAAIVVAVIIGSAAVRSGWKTTNVLLDRSPEPQVLEQVGKVLLSHPEVRGFQHLRARQAGSKVFLDVEIYLDPSITFSQSHDIAHRLARDIYQQVPQVADAVVHVEPASSKAAGEGD